MGSARGTSSERTSTHVERPSVGPLHDQASSLDPLLQLQQTVGNQAVLRLLRAGHAHAKFRHSSAVATPSRSGGGCAAPRARSRPPLSLQKKCARCATGATCSECGEEEELQRKAAHPSSQPVLQRAAKLPTVTSETPSEDQRPAGLIVEDTTKEISTGQMRKTEFLSTLRSLLRPIVEDAPQVGPESNGSYLDKWINDSAGKDSAHLEHAVIKYAPSAAGATTAQGYIDAVVSRVEWGVMIWSTTGQIIGLPPTFASDLPETQKPAADEDTIQRKSADGKDGEADDVSAIQSELSGGNPLASSVRGPMEKAYGTSFSNVKVHTDSKAAELSANLDARAFTIGSDIAFAAGEFKPGTLVGDALIAHELAHVAQQQGGAASGPATKGAANYGSLEEDADLSAVGAMASIWGGVKEGLAGVARSAIPKLRSGLKLQRCNGDTETKGQTPGTPPPQPQPQQQPAPTQQPPDAGQPQPEAEKVDFSICTNKKNREKVEAIIKENPRKYDLTKVKFNIDKFTKNFTEVAKKYVKDNKVTSSTELGIELKELNKGVSEQDGMCVVIIKGWESAAAIAKEKRESCVERIKEFQADENLKKIYKEWVTETVSKDDNGYEPIVDRAAGKKSGLFDGRRGVYAEEVERLNDKWIGSLNENECVALPVGWKDPNIGTLPAKPAAGTLKRTDAAAQAIAVVYAEQTRTSKDAAAAANFEEQQKYIWFSIRKRVTGASYPPDLAKVLDKGQYHAIGKADYNAALDDLEKNETPTLEGVKRAKKVVLDNWTTAVPADAGAGYFHWRVPSTPNTCFAGADKLKADEKEKKEKECAWNWAKSIKIAGTVTKEQGWLKRIRAAGDDPVGSMYIYPGE